jgi:hypothetical protein
VASSKPVVLMIDDDPRLLCAHLSTAASLC